VYFYDSARVRQASTLLTFYMKKGWGSPYPSGGIYWEKPDVTAMIDKASTLPDGAPAQAALYCDAVKKIAAEAAGDLLAQRHPHPAALEVSDGVDRGRRLVAIRISLRQVPLQHVGPGLHRQPGEVTST